MVYTLNTYCIFISALQRLLKDSYFQENFRKSEENNIWIF